MISIPFNNQPESVTIQSGSYTVPSGKFARVTIQARAWAGGYISLSGSIGPSVGLTGGYNHVTQDTSSDSITVYLPAGSDISNTTQSASDSDSGQSNTNQLFASGASFVNVSVDASVVLSVYASAVCYCRNTTSGGTDYFSATVTGSTSVSYTVELFSELS